IVALQRAYEGLLLRHEILRTRIGVTEQGVPCQFIRAETSNQLALCSQDKTNKNDGVEFIGDAKQFLNAFTSKPFRLAEEDLVRAALIEHSHEEHTLAIVMHHIVTDGWSMGIFIQELSS